MTVTVVNSGRCEWGNYCDAEVIVGNTSRLGTVGQLRLTFLNGGALTVTFDNSGTIIVTFCNCEVNKCILVTMGS